MATFAPVSTSIDRERSPCAFNLDPLSSEDEESILRTEDFLNDKLQSQADFSNYDTLITSVENQRAQLHSQLEAARLKLDTAQKESTEHARILRQQTHGFNSHQAGIDQRLSIVTSADAPDEAVEALKPRMEELRKLELAHLYIGSLQEVENLSDDARSHLPASPKEALVSYTRLREVSKTMLALQKRTDGAAAHLVDFIVARSDALWVEMQSRMAKELRTILKKMNYPTNDLESSQEFTECFNKMLDLQEPELVSAAEPLILLPFTVLVEEFKERFKYHFMGDRETNSKNNSDGAFTWTMETFSARQDNLRAVVTPLLAARFKGSQFVDNSLYIDALFAFITAFLPLIREKSEQFLARTAREPQYMSKYIQELIKFDGAVRDRFKYDGGNIRSGWSGVTQDVLSKWYDAWLAAEKQFALARYQDVLKSSDNGSIDYDSNSSGRTRSTVGASKVMGLLTNTTILYQPLRSFSYKLRFLIDIQLSILDLYHNRLQSSVEGFVSMSSAVGRTLHGVSKEDQAKFEGLGGLESLCKVYCSADHVISELHSQSNNVFFVDMWAELQKRARKRDAEDNLAGSMSYQDVKDSTSSAVGSDKDGAVFDETTEAYIRLRSEAERLITEDIVSSVPKLFRNYTQKPAWLAANADDADEDAAVDHITAELDEPLQALKARMHLLKGCLSTATLRRIWKAVSSQLQEVLWRDVILYSRFTLAGGRQFSRDIKAINDMVDNSIAGASSGALGMLKIQDATKILRLPLIPRADAISISEAYIRATTDNTSLKVLWEELQCKELDYTAVRRVVERRVEADENV